MLSVILRSYARIFAAMGGQHYGGVVVVGQKHHIVLLCLQKLAYSLCIPRRSFRRADKEALYLLLDLTDARIALRELSKVVQMCVARAQRVYELGSLAASRFRDWTSDKL